MHFSRGDIDCFEIGRVCNCRTSVSLTLTLDQVMAYHRESFIDLYDLDTKFRSNRHSEKLFWTGGGISYKRIYWDLLDRLEVDLKSVKTACHSHAAPSTCMSIYRPSSRTRLNLSFMIVDVLSSTNTDQSRETMIFSHPLFDCLQAKFTILHTTITLSHTQHARPTIPLSHRV